MLFVFYFITVLASSQDNTDEDEAVDNKDERLPGTLDTSCFGLSFKSEI